MDAQGAGKRNRTADQPDDKEDGRDADRISARGGNCSHVL